MATVARSGSKARSTIPCRSVVPPFLASLLTTSGELCWSWSLSGDANPVTCLELNSFACTVGSASLSLFPHSASCSNCLIAQHSPLLSFALWDYPFLFSFMLNVLAVAHFMLILLSHQYEAYTQGYLNSKQSQNKI